MFFTVEGSVLSSCEMIDPNQSNFFEISQTNIFEEPDSVCGEGFVQLTTSLDLSSSEIFARPEGVFIVDNIGAYWLNYTNSELTYSVTGTTLKYAVDRDSDDPIIYFLDSR